jgi:hypothetical protein
LGATPVGDGVEQVHDSVSELYEAHHDGGHGGHGTGDGALARAT